MQFLNLKQKNMNKILYLFTLLFSLTISSQDFQGQAFYKTQTAMDFGSWGDRMSAEQKKSMKERIISISTLFCSVPFSSNHLRLYVHMRKNFNLLFPFFRFATRPA